MRILLRAAPDEDLWGEFETIAEGFVAAGSEAQMRARTEHSDEHWARARATGSSRPAGEGAFADAGLIVQDASDHRQRWLPRVDLAAYLGALLADDSARRLQLTESLEEPTPAIFQRFHIGDQVMVLPDRSRGGPWILGEVRNGRNPDQQNPDELLVKLSTTGEIRWFAADQVHELRYFVTTQVFDPHDPIPNTGYWAVGEIGVALPGDSENPRQEGVLLHFGRRASHNDNPGIPYLAGLLPPDRIEFVEHGKVREIDSATVRAEVDDQGRVLRYVAAPAESASEVAQRRRAERAQWARGSSSSPPTPAPPNQPRPGRRP